jgi:hypothetical protein
LAYTRAFNPAYCGCCLGDDFSGIDPFPGSNEQLSFE